MKKLLVIFAIFFVTTTFAQTTEKRIALVIGNAEYTSSPLKNPANDAELMSKTLEKLGFTVRTYTDVTFLRMNRAIQEFAKDLDNYNVALFYFAGHGVQSNGVNYLIPIDAMLNEEVDLEFEAIDVNKVVHLFEKYDNNTNIVILDACRNNPYKTWSRGGNHGFKAIAAPSGTIIGFATAEGSTSADGAGKNGVYTENLVKQMQKSQSIEEVFKQTHNAVKTLTNKQQLPQYWSQYGGNFNFVQTSKNEIIAKGNDTTTASDQKRTPQIKKVENVLKYGSISVFSEIAGQVLLDDNLFTEIKANQRIEIDDIEQGSHKFKLIGSDTLEQKRYINEGENPEITFKAVSPFALKADFTISGVAMRGIVGGTFTMGSSESGAGDDETPHTVTLSNFAIMKTEVTQKLWTEIMGTNPSTFKGNNLPVENVSWLDVQEFITRFNTKNGQTWRLPTEAEWEFAAKGGQNYRFAGSDNIETVAWHKDNAAKTTHQVGQKSPNGYGLYDMTGNVWEWCSDWYNGNYYKLSPATNPKGLSNGTIRVLRGGSWNKNAGICRVAFRSNGAPDYRDSGTGFRLVLVP